MLAMACDRRIAVDDASYRIGVNETALGMVFPTWAVVIAQSRDPTRAPHRHDAARLDLPARGGRTHRHRRARGGRPTTSTPPSTQAAAAAAALPTEAYAGTKRQLRAAEAARAAAEVQREMSGFRGPA